ncbi:MAG: ParB/RepB/Spo0J family partition protein, partial [bacterium]|nr:ParB/RepB/Spo0J family partition protein [bacterium]
MSQSQFFSDSIFWIEVEKVKPNPFQPRHEFDDAKLKDLAESIRMYGILQPLVVTRKEFAKPEGGMGVEYELISGERRLRASKIAGLSQVPALIRSGPEDARIKLELAIIENLQREDLNAVDRARSFERLVKEFGLKHVQIAEKVGKSREYVSNTLRILALPEEMINALSEGKMTDGHTRPLLMLTDRPEEQLTLFKEIVLRKI